MDYNTIKNNHMANLGRMVGHEVGGRYSYIVSQNDLVNTYLQIRDELGYPLMIDSKKRRAIVYNKKGLEKQIQNIINECIINNIHLLNRIVVQDIVGQLNGLVQTANGKLTVGKNSGMGSMANMFVNAMARGLVGGIGKIIEDITNDDRR